MRPLIQGFDILEPIGTGASGAVWRARDQATGRLVALKILHPHAAVSERQQERFLHEVRAYERLQHPNVISCVRGGRAGDDWFVALELLTGGDLAQVVRVAGCVPADIAVFIAAGVAAALQHAHAAGVFHRDVKPGNVMLTAEGVPKLADFGIATPVDYSRLVEVDHIVGTPAYMAPELLAGGAADVRSDLWSLGVVLYEMVCGRNPYAGTTIQATVERLRSQTPAPLGYRAPGVSRELEDIAESLLQVDPAGRPGSAGEVAAALGALLPRGGSWSSQEAVRALLAEPAAATARWRAERAGERVELARALLRMSQPRFAGAWIEAAEARRFESDNPAARQLLVDLAERVEGAGARSKPPPAPSARIVGLERQAEERPANLQLLVNLVRAARAEGDLARAVRAYRWGRRRGGDDRFSHVQLANALGFELAAHIDGRRPEELKSLLGGEGSGSSPGHRSARSLLFSWPIWIAIGALLLVVVLDRPASMAVLDVPTPPAAVSPPPPDVAAVALDKAAYLMDAARPARALAIYEHFLSRWPQHERVEEVMFERARALEDLGRLDPACAAYQQLIASSHASDRAVAARHRLAVLQERAGRPQLALESLDGLVAVGDPEDRAETELSRARLLTVLGRPLEAMAVADRLLASNASQPVAVAARLERGRALASRNDPEAMRWLSEAAALAEPGGAVAEEASRLLEQQRAAFLAEDSY